jgi:hypothetical protein
MPWHPPSLSRVPSESVPPLHRSIADAARSRSRRSPHWLGADSIHRSDLSLGCVVGSRRRLRCRALVIRCPNRHVVDVEAGLSQVPGEPFTRAPRADAPVEPDHQAIAMVRCCRRLASQQRLPPCAHFGAVYRGPRCSLSTLHPGEGHSPICKTRFRLLTRLCRTRVSHPRRVPSRGFGHVLGQVIAFLLSQASLAHKACAPAAHCSSGPELPP